MSRRSFDDGEFYDDEPKYDLYGRLRSERRPVHANYNMKATFPHIHYSNDYWNTARTIWGAEEKGIHYEYSDRIWQWDYDKADKSQKEATAKLGHGFTPEWIQLFLTLYHGKQVELRHVMGGVNLGNGYNYYVYGFRFKEETPAAATEEAKAV